MVKQPECNHNDARDVIGIYGGHVRNRRRRPLSSDRGVADFTPEQGRAAMQIDWMTLGELSQAIPPAYTEYLGRVALENMDKTPKFHGANDREMLQTTQAEKHACNARPGPNQVNHERAHNG